MIGKKETWGIAGGGILGMSLAHQLTKSGYKVSLYEAANDLGGLAASWQLNDITWDKFYHVILLSDLNTRKLLKELNLEKEIKWVETKTGFYTDGKLYSMSNTLEFLKFPPLNLIDKIRLGATIFFASKIKNWKKLEQVSVESWLQKWSGSNTFNKIWLPLLKAKLGDNYKNASAAFIWATIQRMYSARREGLKKEMFGYVTEGGYSRILREFYKVLEKDGVEIKTGHSINKVCRFNDRVRIDFNNGKSETVDKAVLTMPSPVIQNVCPDLSADEKEKLKNIKYLGVVCASLILKKPLNKFYVTNVTDSFAPFTGVIEMSALVDKKEFKGENLVYLPKYVTPDDPVFNKTDEEIKEDFFCALKKMYSHINDDDLVCFKIARAKNVFALSTINYSEKLPSIATSIPGVFILNSSHIVNGTLNVNETLGLIKNKFQEFI